MISNTILSLGKIDEIQSDTQKKILADRIEFYLSVGHEIFTTVVPEHVEKVARHWGDAQIDTALTQH